MYSSVATLFMTSKKLIASAAVFLLCALLAAYGPMVSISNAQTAIDTSSFTSLRQKVIDELNHRISSYEATIKSLGVNASVSGTYVSATVSSDSGTTSISTSDLENVLKSTISLPSGMKDKVKSFLQAIISELKGLLNKVTAMDPSSASTNIDQLKAIASNVDSQYGLDQLANVQSTVTQAIDSMTAVFDNLKSAASDLHSQIVALRQCLKAVANGSTNTSGTINGSDGAAISCGDFNLSASDIADNIQTELTNVSAVMSTISSVISSTVTLLASLITQFGNLTSGINGLDGLSNLGGMLDSDQLSSLTHSFGGTSGMIDSFSAIISQLDITNGMSGNAENLLGSLTSLVNV